MYEVNTVPKPDEGLNISKLVIQLNSVSDEPWRIQYSITGFGRTAKARSSLTRYIVLYILSRVITGLTGLQKQQGAIANM